jgi:hypothetical protein
LGRFHLPEDIGHLIGGGQTQRGAVH